MSPKEQRELASECGAVADVKTHMNGDGDSIVFIPEELASYTYSVEAKERDKANARIELLENLLHKSDEWLLEHDNVVEMKVLEKVVNFFASDTSLQWSDYYIDSINKMIESRKHK